MVPNNAEAAMDGYEMVAKSSKDNITLYAKKIDGLYYDFKIDFMGRIASKPFWLSAANNQTYAPQIIYEDIGRDENKELIIVLNKGYGTGVLVEDVYVIEANDIQFREVLVENPLVVVLKNTNTKLTPTEAKINMGDHHFVKDISSVDINPENIFKDIVFGSIIKYEVENSHLVARINAQVSPAYSFGEVVITYEYLDKMYQAQSIDFQPYK